MSKCLVFEDGVLIKNTIEKNGYGIWDGLFSKMTFDGKILEFVRSCLPKNTILVIPKSDGNIKKTKDPSQFSDVDWDTQIQPYIDYAAQVNKTFIIGTLAQVEEEPGYNYLYLPLDDGIFHDGISRYFNRSTVPRWEDRSSQLCWRGGCSGVGRNQSLRVRVVEKIYNYTPDTNVRLSTWWSENKNIPANYFAERFHFSEFTKYKIVFIIDGAVIASNHMYAFSLGCVPFLISNSKCWFSHLLVPGVHYVPVNYDLSNLISQIEWVRNHDEEAKQIADNAMVFAETYFSSEYQKKYIQESIDKLVCAGR